MQTAWVVGGAGFLGSHLCERLLHDGLRVICIDNLITGSRENIKNFEQNPQFTFIKLDVITLRKWDVRGENVEIEGGSEKKEPFQPPTSNLKIHIPTSNIHLRIPNFIFHLASPASPNKNSLRSYIAFPIETLLVNSMGTYNLLEITRKTGAGFLYASTSEVYGDPSISPQPETYFGNVNPNGIRSVYDEGKRFSEALTMAYVRKYHIDARIIRIFNTYGPKMQKDDGRVVSNFINQALANNEITIYGDGKQTRSFCYVSDMIEGIIKAMFTGNITGEVINLGNPIERTIEHFAQIVKAATGSNSSVVYEDMPEDDPKQRRPDIRKAKKLLGWEPIVTLEEGLRKTIEYFKNV